jgi:hypothetical protein
VEGKAEVHAGTRDGAGKEARAGARSSRWPTPKAAAMMLCGRRWNPGGRTTGNGEDVISAFFFNLTPDCFYYGK